MQKIIRDDLDEFINVLPLPFAEKLKEKPNLGELLEVIIDLGRQPEARFHNNEVSLSSSEVTQEDIEYIVCRVSLFGDDNRAGITRTLHRISAIRNRRGVIIGLTCRVGRAVFGTIKVIEDLIQTGKSILLLGRPGVGKTTMLREVARVMSDNIKKRVIIVDTSNEIAGDGDIPHPAIGRARRMQVPRPELQHAVMIEAVENHMPQAIVIDEIGTELEAAAARTIAERGVQLVGTAHGNTLDNLIMNPTLSDLIGGIQSVTLGDEEARRRGTQKSILERKAPPTFQIVVEIQDFDHVAIHPDVAEAVDEILRRNQAAVEVRWVDENGEVKSQKKTPPGYGGEKEAQEKQKTAGKGKANLFVVGVNRSRLEQVASDIGTSINIVDRLPDANVLITLNNLYHRKPQKIREAEDMGIPIYVMKTNSHAHMRQFIITLFRGQHKEENAGQAIKEAQGAVSQIEHGQKEVELSPQSSFIRRLQHQIAERSGLTSYSMGKEPQRRVKFVKGNDE